MCNLPSPHGVKREPVVILIVPHQIERSGGRGRRRNRLMNNCEYNKRITNVMTLILSSIIVGIVSVVSISIVFVSEPEIQLLDIGSRGNRYGLIGPDIASDAGRIWWYTSRCGSADNARDPNQPVVKVIGVGT